MNVTNNLFASLKEGRLGPEPLSVCAGSNGMFVTPVNVSKQRLLVKNGYYLEFVIRLDICWRN